MYKIFISFYQAKINLSIVRRFHSKNKALIYKHPPFNVFGFFKIYSSNKNENIVFMFSYFQVLYSQNINASILIFALHLNSHHSLNRKDCIALQQTAKQVDWQYWNRLWKTTAMTHLNYLISFTYACFTLKLSNIWVKPKDFHLEVKWIRNSVGFALISGLLLQLRIYRIQFCFTRHCFINTHFKQVSISPSSFYLDFFNINISW